MIRKIGFPIINALNNKIVIVIKSKDIYKFCTSKNMDGVDKTLQYMDSIDKGLVFTNLVNFHVIWGYRKNTKFFIK